MDRHYPDRGAGYLAGIIFKNDRLSYYDMYIERALDHGYIVTSYIDYLEHYMDKCLKVMILRHDVDNSCSAVERMFEIERKYGVKATYYFRWSTIDMNLIRELDRHGFEAGLHYETLGRYCEENNISSVDAGILKSCREILKAEIDKFNKWTGIRIKTCASHGHPKNMAMGISNNVLFEGEDYKSYGLEGEAYDRDFYEREKTVHISDCNILYNYGFFYGSNPLKEIYEGRKVVVFLSHPEYWQYSINSRIKMMVKLLSGRYTTSSSEEFKRIAWGSLIESQNRPGSVMEYGGNHAF